MMSTEQAEVIADAIDRAANDIASIGNLLEADRSTDGELGGNVVDGLDHIAEAIRFHARAVMSLAEAICKAGQP